jgi:HPt (histidine-containing phosphotransfer) domain-containing protein
MPAEAVLNPMVLDGIRKVGGEALLDRLVDCFLSYGPDRYRQLTVAIRGQDWSGVEKHAHALRSSAGNVGARELLALLSEIEVSAGQGRTEVIPRVVENLEERYAEFLDALTRLRRPAA